MDKEFVVLYFLLFVSGCVIIHLVNKLRDVKSLVQSQLQDENVMGNIVKELEKKVNNDFIDMWDEDYKAIISTYGNTKKFIEAHYLDYDIYRSNVLVFISKIQTLSKTVQRAIEIVSNSIKKSDTMDKDMILLNLEVLNSSLTRIINEVVDEATQFVKSEEEAHSDKREIDEVLKKLPKEIREVNFYEQKEN